MMYSLFDGVPPIAMTITPYLEVQDSYNQATTVDIKHISYWPLN